MMKKKAKGSFIGNIVLIIAAAVFLYAAWQLVSAYMQYKKGTDEYDRLEKLVEIQPEETQTGVSAAQTTAADAGETQPESQTPSGTGEAPKLVFTSDHSVLKEINSDYAGWLYMNSEISYPVVAADNNDYYLTHTFYGTKNKAGTLFLEAALPYGMQSKNVIIYGHNLKNDKMFGTLMKYQDQSFFEEHRYFQIFTESGTMTCEIFAAYTTSAVSDAYTYGFGSDELFLEYIETMKGWSEIDTGVTVEAGDQIVTLSTCTNVNDGRFVVQGKVMK